jgi:wyosine [tRNA(Phe)-imidazoG37] synthetase (radical SAM superfamily)
MPNSTLNTGNHDRHIAGLKYIYPVISRRAGGLSIGINFNPNNACNWRCIYCQVPDLINGNAPEMDFELLGQELHQFLDFVQHGDFYDHFNLEPQHRNIKDLAISGNGEPTSLKNFDQAVALIGEIATKAGVFPSSHFVLISNGSLLHQPSVQNGLKVLADYDGEIWFKLDSATPEGRKLTNNTGQSQQKLLDNLKIASSLCRTKLQTCMLHYQQLLWSEDEKLAYLQLLSELQQNNIRIEQIMLYSLARQSFQLEAENLHKVGRDEMLAFADRIKEQGYKVSVSE